jgi:hypothetical protein
MNNISILGSGSVKYKLQFHNPLFIKIIHERYLISLDRKKISLLFTIIYLRILN